MKRAYSDRFTAIPAMILEIDVFAHATARKARLLAKVDTGADLTVVPLHLIKDLRLVEFGRCNVHTVNHDPYTAPTYRADVVIDNAKFGALTVVAHRKPYILLGRDVLNQLILIADGPSETFELVSSKSKPQ